MGIFPVPLPIPVQRSWLFEVVEVSTSQIVESFALVIPPTNVQVKEKHRVSVTKTFGNVFVDDYGPDNLDLVIKGFSGTAHAFPTYETMGFSNEYTPFYDETLGYSPFGYTHRTAFYYFQAAIMRYKKDKDKPSDYIIRVFDLYDELVYDCVLIDFTMDRGADRPLHYPFTIVFLVLSQPSDVGYTGFTPINVGGSIFDLLAAISQAMAWLDSAFQFIQNIKGFIAAIQNTVNLMAKRFETYLTMARTIATSPLDIAKQCIDLVGSLSQFLDAAYVQGKMTEEAYVNGKEMITEAWRSNMSLYAEAVRAGSQTSMTEVIEVDLGVDVPDPDGGSFAAEGSLGAPEAARSAQIVSYNYTGVNLYTVKGADTLQSIALRQLGNVDLWPIVASMNKLLNNEELQARESIYLPSTVNDRAAVTKDSYVLTEDVARNPYGTDIRLDTEGRMILSETNDVSTVSSIDNIQQAVDIIMKTRLGSMIKQVNVGLMSQPGLPGTEMALAYTRMSVRMALLSDPRVEAISNVRLFLVQDDVKISMNIKPIGYDATIPVEVTI